MTGFSVFGRLRSGFCRFGSVAVAGLVLAVAAPQAPAQFGGMGGGANVFSPSFNTRQLQRYADMLGLSPEQREVVELLFQEGYMAEHQQQVRKVREQMEEARRQMRDGGGRGMGGGGFARFGEVFREAATERQAMDQRFLDDVKAVLEDTQLEQWPAVERAFRRERMVPMGLMSGERVDLISIVQDLEFEEGAKADLAPILEQYEMDLDRALQRRMVEYERAMARVTDLMESGDFERMQEVVDRVRPTSVQVRDTNRRYARQIESVLTDEQARESFSNQFKRASFPDVYRPTRASRTFDRALAFEDLSDDQRQRLEAAHASHQRRLNRLNEELAKAIVEAEENFNIFQMMGGAMGGQRGAAGRGGDRGGWGRNQPGAEVRQQRQELDRTTVESIRGILTPEQTERLRGDDDARPQQRRGAPPQRRGSR